MTQGVMPCCRSVDCSDAICASYMQRDWMATDGATRRRHASDVLDGICVGGERQHVDGT